MIYYLVLGRLLLPPPPPSAVTHIHSITVLLSSSAAARAPVITFYFYLPSQHIAINKRLLKNTETRFLLKHSTVPSQIIPYLILDHLQSAPPPVQLVKLNNYQLTIIIELFYDFFAHFIRHGSYLGR